MQSCVEVGGLDMTTHGMIDNQLFIFALLQVLISQKSISTYKHDI